MAAHPSTRERRLNKKSREITDEIREINDLLYNVETKDIEQRYFMLERQRDDVVRSFVLQFHTAIEDLMDTWLKSVLLEVKAEDVNSVGRTRRAAARATSEFLRSIGFENKVKLLLAFRLIRQPLVQNLLELNRIRNKCGHNWLLKVHVRRGIKPWAPKRPLLQFRGQNLYEVTVLQEFGGVYGPLYARLFARIYN
jgi:hypothetical protein